MHEATTLQQTDHWHILLNPDQQNLGKSLVVLKDDKESLAELSPEEWKEFGVIVKALERAITSEFHPTHFNWQCLMNNAYGENAQDKPHVHWHVSPRYAEPVIVDGYKFTDENYPRTNKESLFIEDALLESIAKRITLHLDSE